MGDTVDTVESVKPKLPQNHTTVAMVDTDTVDTVESVKPKLPQNHTTEVMVDTVDMVDTATASKHLISNILPIYIPPTFNLESFTKIQDNMFQQLVITSKSLQNLKFEESFDSTVK